MYIYNFVDYADVRKEDQDEWKSFSSKSKIIFDYVLDGIYTVVLPAIVKVEIASVINYLTGDKDYAEAVIEGLEKLEREKIIDTVYLDDMLTYESISFTYKSKLKSTDAIIATCCLTNPSTLITNDTKLHDSVRNVLTNSDMDERIDSIFLKKVEESQLHDFFKL